LSGRLFGIGTGPGDPELVTLKAIRVARAADLVVYVHAKGRPSRARATMAPHLAPGTAEHGVELDMGPDRTAVDRAYDRLALDLKAALARGADVAVLCEGDPLVFGTFLYLLQRLPDAPVTVVPGISSPQAAAAALAWPFAKGDETFAVLPATMGVAALGQRLALVTTAAIIKVGRHVEEVRALLDGLGLLDTAWLAVEVTTPGERLVRLADWPEPTAPYFALVLTHGLGGERG
jgi:precorrin-2/cobalt-factor-2 C20-methyltransferase